MALITPKGVSYNGNNRMFRSQVWRAGKVMTLGYCNAMLEAMLTTWQWYIANGRVNCSTSCAEYLLTRDFHLLYEVVQASNAIMCGTLAMEVRFAAMALTDANEGAAVDGRALIRLAEDVERFESVAQAKNVVGELFGLLQTALGAV